MHICMVMAGDEEGGLEKHLVELANGLAQAGQKVTLIAHEKYAERVSGVEFKALDLSKSRKNPILLWQLYQTIKATHADVLHVQANKAVSMIAPMLKWLKIPSVATLHNLKRNVQAFEKYDRIIAVSRRVANQFSQQDRVRVVLNGIQPPVHQAAQKQPHQPLQAIAVARLVPAKGFDLLVQAWQGIDAKLWIVGDGPDRDLLQEKIQQYALTDRIELLGHRNDITMLMQQADFLVISSRNEGGPYTLAEALLVHCPVISTDVGMVAEVLPAELICPANDVTALHDLIQQHVQHFEQLTERSEPIYQSAQQQLTLEAVLHNTLQVYQELSHA
ncbi:glycosyltransferase [Acinetobacter baumannii]|uniref:glycosyltransferase n=1 Tax=Acinetobacter baumannii TaxID=470 RepID=UPI00138F8CCA|nr:glycosyltransferase [Acinetobacter baumannii]NDM33253.1 glycosyltransferase [Acinetobacter baumannii]QJH22584.1 glycosyltransferase [Acinetobacter baumannii]